MKDDVAVVLEAQTHTDGDDSYCGAVRVHGHVCVVDVVVVVAVGTGGEGFLIQVLLQYHCWRQHLQP